MDQAKLLIKLQDTDLAMMRARKRLDEMPEKASVLETRKRIRELDSLRTKTHAAWEAVDREVRKHEDEAAALSAKIDTEQDRLMSGSVTNPKEVQNISREMDSLKRHKDKLENSMLDEMENREMAAEHTAKVDTAIEVARRKEAAAIADFQGKSGELQSIIQRLVGERALLAREIEAGLLARYESLRDEKHGIGAGTLKDGMCSACRMELPAEKTQALRDVGSPIGICPACHRLLVVVPSPEEGRE
jgi:predicted  nucleic acid-binding Zn-ribbon protein